MNAAIKMTKNTATKDMIMEFNNAKIGFNEQEDIANRLISKMRSTKTGTEKFKIVKHLMKYTMNDAVECVKESKSKLDKSKKNLNQVVRKGTLVRELFMETVNVEVGVVWKNGKHKNDKKLKFSVQKRE